MDLRRPTTEVLAAAGALLIVGSLSLGNGVAAAVPAPAADGDKATTTSGPKSSKPSKSSKEKSKKSTSTTESTGPNGPARSTGSTASTSTTASTRPRSTATTAPATTGTTAPARSANTVAPTTTSTAAPADTAPQQVDPSTDPSTDASTPDSGSDPSSQESPPSNQPTARSGSGLPPGIYPVGPSPKSAGSTPAATTAPTPVAPVPDPSVTTAPAETQPTREGTGTVSEEGATDPVTDSLLDAGVSGAEVDRGDTPAPATRRNQQLSQTGDGTRRLLLLGGVALLLGAVVVAFTGRERPALPVTAGPVGPAAGRRARPRREIDGWEDGVPLAPAKRELARALLGISGAGPRDDAL